MLCVNAIWFAQRWVIFPTRRAPQVGRNVEAYIDDLMVKTQDRATLLEDLAETFNSLRTTRLKLNPEKCVFGVPAGKLLGFLVSG